MSLVQTISNVLVPVRREGWPFVAAFGAAAILLGLLWSPLFWIGLALTGWCAYFFRDPQRVTPVDENLVVSPADGRVSAVGPAVPPSELGLGPQAMTRISIFMNVFSVHVNRAPVRGHVSMVRHTPGKFLNADLDKASIDNERNSLLVDGPHGQVAVVQVAGLVARRILCWAAEGDHLAPGERFGLIRFGSRLDVYLPPDAHPRVAVGQTAIAGETVIAEYGGAPAGPVVRVS